MAAITVFGSARNGIDPAYVQDAKELGKLVGIRKHTLVYGGGRIGLHGLVATEAQKNGSRVIGVIPRNWLKYADQRDELVVTNDLRDRKAKMMELSEGSMVLPRGFGTLDELADALVSNDLGYTPNPVVFLNTQGFYEPLSKLFESMKAQKFIIGGDNVLKVASTPLDAIETLEKCLVYEFNSEE